MEAVVFPAPLGPAIIYNIGFNLIFLEIVGANSVHIFNRKEADN